MGRATRWLRNILGGGSKRETKDKHEIKENNSNPTSYVSMDVDRREKKRWSFGKSTRDSGDATSAPPVGGHRNPAIAKAAEAAWLKSLYDETEREQSKHAIAVAAATAAAADAAVAAAQAAVAVVRLTSQGRGNVFGFAGAVAGGGAPERFAAVKIQTAFRGYLAKKALRALKALVKLQALVRGYLVRKQAAATLHSIQALIRAQATIRASKSRNLIHADRGLIHTQIRHRRSLQERCDDTRSELAAPSYNRRLSASTETGFDRSPKIVEIDTVRPKSRSSRQTSPPTFDPIEDLPPISIPSSRNFSEYDWSFITTDKCTRLPATAQSTPRYINCPVTPAKSTINVSNCPNYMVNTQSFEAKVRSQSAPKQRPEPIVSTNNNRKRVPLSEVMIESRASLSGVGMQRSCYKAQEIFNFKSAVVDRLDRSSELSRESERDYYLQRKW